MNYPGGIKVNKQTKTNVTYGNRGMSLEEDLNITNTYYQDKGIAYIYKKPTPIKIVAMNYEKNKITEAYFESPSTTDYNGIYKSYYIDYEAKETKSKTSFPLRNIHKHQINHIRNIIKEDGIVFLIVRFTTLNKTYILFGNDFINYIDNNDNKSIKLAFFNEKGHLINEGYMPRLNYIEIIDNYIGGKYE